MVLFFALGVTAGYLKSDLTVPEAISKGVSLYLMLAIGFKGGAELATSGINERSRSHCYWRSCLVSACPSLLMPCYASRHGSTSQTRQLYQRTMARSVS